MSAVLTSSNLVGNIENPVQVSAEQAEFIDILMEFIWDSSAVKT